MFLFGVLFSCLRTNSWFEVRENKFKTIMTIIRPFRFKLAEKPMLQVWKISHTFPYFILQAKAIHVAQQDNVSVDLLFVECQEQVQKKLLGLDSNENKARDCSVRKKLPFSFSLSLSKL